MSVTRDRFLVGAVTVAFAVVTVLIFFHRAWVLPLFSTYLFLVFSVQFLKQTSFAFMLTGFATLLGFFCLEAASRSSLIGLAALILTLWGGVLLLHLHHTRLKGRFSNVKTRRAQIEQELSGLKKEAAFYEQKKSDLLRRASQRRHLVAAARTLGSCLEAVEIQNKLIEISHSIFPDRPVDISVGHTHDPVDMYVIQKGQAALVPTKSFPGWPLLAVPIKTQGAVAGVLRVGGNRGSAFSQEDLRLLEILGSLASLSLENSSLFKQTQESALRDNLTGLWTHRAFQEHLEAALLEASRYGQSISLILTDVDHFKAVNDTHGHQAGDSVLQGVSHVLARHVRDVDMVARYGGEEFVVLLLQTSHSEARHVADEIRRDLESQRFNGGSAVIGVTGSFGVATFPQDATSAQQLIRVADERLYTAKKAGRNQVRGQAA